MEEIMGKKRGLDESIKSYKIVIIWEDTTGVKGTRLILAF